MAKATHQGECQICGRIQALPKGKLSKHGYTVDFAYFNGVCAGARALPFEQSKDLIAVEVEKAERYIDDQKSKITQLRAENTSGQTSGWFHEYVSATWEYRHSYYRWVRVNYYEKEGSLVFDTPTTKGIFTNRYAGMGQNIEENIKVGNDKLALFNEKKIEGTRQWIKWQNDRMENWQPRELTPIKEII